MQALIDDKYCCFLNFCKCEFLTYFSIMMRPVYCSHVPRSLDKARHPCKGWLDPIESIILTCVSSLSQRQNVIQWENSVRFRGPLRAMQWDRSISSVFERNIWKQTVENRWGQSWPFLYQRRSRQIKIMMTLLPVLINILMGYIYTGLNLSTTQKRARNVKTSMNSI